MEKIKKSRFTALLRSFDFRTLFNELGWDHFSNKLPIVVQETTILLQGIAQKKGFAILLCEPLQDGSLPRRSFRLQLEKKTAEHYHEHLIIYTDFKKSQQVWQLAVNVENKPFQVKDVTWYVHQDAEILFQRLQNLLFTLNEEDTISIVDVTQRVSENFAVNTEKVTKKFYTEFNKQHGLFLNFIDGIDDHIEASENSNKQWYTSIMLNRLMFCYFIQKRGFLDQDIHYLRNKLKLCKDGYENDTFYSFYRSFLIELFHNGLGKPGSERLATLPIPLGNIPYLNGGLFDVHELEQQFKNIQIGDEAFQNIFGFFDQWNWHLDTRYEATGKDINPDVIGYIFEKYINDRADMGSYYTKEDITDYIGKNTIIPFLLDKTQKTYKNAFKPTAQLWQFLKQSGDAYIHGSIKFGIPSGRDLISDLPENIQSVIEIERDDQLAKGNISHGKLIHETLNEKAPSEFSSTPETYLELINRRKYYRDVKEKIETGKIIEINDFITYNLNIRQFIQDFLGTVEDPEFLLRFYRALENITILDPTVGSGAFLFAALNILEPLYEICLERMEQYVIEEPGKYSAFEKILSQVSGDNHPNLRYFIYKSIILNNLYGVDIMKEAVEIAKLRLFLKLVAAVEVNPQEKNFGLEPLPDIDFNIRAGNTLVGFAHEDELWDTISKQEGMFADEIVNSFKEEIKLVSKAYEHFQKCQITNDAKSDDYREAKSVLITRQKVLNKKLDQYLATNYGIKWEENPKGYNAWLESHQPFHWFAQFYRIVGSNGGFDVVIGNPPYIRISKVQYSLDSDGFNSSDLYGFVIRRVFSIVNNEAKFGFIVMHNLSFSNGFSDVRRMIRQQSSSAWFSFYARIPAGLFSGDVRVRNCVFIIDCDASKNKTYYTTRIHRWFSENRVALFPNLRYTGFSFKGEIPRFPDQNLMGLFSSKSNQQLATYCLKISSHKLFFKKSAYNWITVTPTSPPSFDALNKPIEQTQVSEIRFESEEAKLLSMLYLNGKINFSRWLCFGDEFHVTNDDLLSAVLPINEISATDKDQLFALAEDFVGNLDSTLQFKLNAGKNVGSYNTAKLWYITDSSDHIFLKYLTNRSRKIVEAIELHIGQTIMTQK